jgi:hypothetical protein
MRFRNGCAFPKTIFLAATLLSLLASPALAEEANGKFTLTKEVHWGSNVLPAGEYTYRLQHDAFEVLFVRSAGGERGFIVLARSVSATNGERTDSLQLERSGDDWFVSSLTLGSLGERLYFAAPPPHAPMAARSTSDNLTSLAKR